jgi:archaellin
MGLNRIGEDIQISGTVSSPGFYGSFIGDGSGLTNLPGGGGGGGATASVLLETTTLGYNLATNAQKAYRMVRPTTSYAAATIGINGEAIYATKFYATPGTVINEIAMRVNTAGAAGLGLAAVRFLIYRSQLNANGEIVGGDLELDTGVNMSTLSTGGKVTTGLNHTLSSNTYGDCWFMCVRNYQTGSLQVKAFSNTTVLCDMADVASASGTIYRDMSWYWTVPWTDATPASMPATSGTVASTTTVTEYSQVLVIGYSATA